MRVTRGDWLATVGVAAVLLAATGARAACTPGTFTGPTETCSGLDTSIVANVTADQTVILQDEHVSTGGVQLSGFGASINVTAPTGSSLIVNSTGGDAIAVDTFYGNLDVTTGSGVAVRATGESGSGISLFTFSADPQLGGINIVAGGDVWSDGGAGIQTFALFDGDTTITTAAGATVRGGGSNGAIYASSGFGSITINSNAVTRGSISGLSSNGGAVTINVNADVTADGPVGLHPNGGVVQMTLAPGVTVQSSSGWGVFGLGTESFELDTGAKSKLISFGGNATVEVTTGLFTLNNSGLLTSTSGGHQGTAVFLLDGSFFGLPATAATIDNRVGGVLDGQLLVQKGAITLDNTGIWYANGVSVLGAGGGLGQINNNGLIQVGLTTQRPAATTSEFDGLGGFNNGSPTATGTISMVNGTVGDSLTISSPFVGASGHSVLYLDAFLGGPGSTADQLNLLGGSAGLTLIRIHDTSTGAGAVNSQGIVLVTGVSSASDFALDPNAPNFDSKHQGVNHGLFLFTLNYAQGNEVLIGSPGAGAYNLSTAPTAAQQIWQSTSVSPDSQEASGATFSSTSVGLDGARVWMRAANGAADYASAAQPLFSALGRSYGEGGDLSSRVSPDARNSGFDTGYSQGTAFLLAGFDLMRHQRDRAAWSIGLATGYVASDQIFTTGPNGMLFSGAVVGLYASYQKAGLHAGATLKSDLLKAEYVGQRLGQTRPSTSATSTGAQLDASYSTQINSWLTVEPLASAAVNWTTLGALQVGETTVRFEPTYSGWVNAGLRVSGQAFEGGYAIKGSMTLRAWDTFGGANTLFLSNFGPNLPVTTRTNGVSGEFGSGLSISRGGQAEGFLSSAIRYGAGRQSIGAIGGIRVRW